MQRDSIPHTLAVTLALAVGCSLLVSTAAVGLRGIQEKNKALSKKSNILKVAGLYRPEMDIEAEFDRNVHVHLIDLRTGEFANPPGIDPSNYDQRSAARDPQLSEFLPPESARAGIVRRESYSVVYLIEKDGWIDQVVLPFYGKGLFSTLYGFLAVDSDRNTIRGVTFYEHGETPGLGGEVDDVRWTEGWKGRQLFEESGEVAIALHKGSIPVDAPGAEYGIDGLSGATMTSKGITEMLRFWLGKDGFGPFLQKTEF